MTHPTAPDPEARLRVAVETLVDALLDALRQEAAQAAAGPERLLSIDEAARALGIGRSALYAELAADRIRSIKIGRRRLIPSSAIAERAGR